MKNEDLNNPYKHVEKIKNYAQKITNLIYKKTKVNKTLIYYEEIFFFYFLNDVVFSLTDKPIYIKNQITALLFNEIEYDYKDIKLHAFFRQKTYCNILLKYSEKISIEFLQDSFQYQSELINYISENNTLAPLKYSTSSLSDWLFLASDNKLIKKVNKLLVNKCNIIYDFIAE